MYQNEALCGPALMGLMQTPPAVVASTLVPEALLSFMLKLPVLWIVSWVIVPTRPFQPQMAVAGRGLQGGPCSNVRIREARNDDRRGVPDYDEDRGCNQAESHSKPQTRHSSVPP